MAILANLLAGEFAHGGILMDMRSLRAWLLVSVGVGLLLVVWWLVFRFFCHGRLPLPDIHIRGRKKLKVFLSHSSKDKEFVLRLHADLMSRNFDPWMDHHALRAGDMLFSKIMGAMEGMDVVIVILSPNAVVSQWVQIETEAALQLEFDRKVRIIPFIYEPSTPPLSLRSRLQIRLGSSYAEALADLVDALQPVPGSSGPPPEDFREEVGRLRRSRQLQGRNSELASLDKDWDNFLTGVRIIHAIGGQGKTALVAEWSHTLVFGKDNSIRPRRAFDWSFFSQGSQDQQEGGDVDRFFKEAFAFFEVTTMPQSPWKRGVELARLVQSYRTLLILDGLEPLQDADGTLKEASLQSLLRELATHNPGLCIVTTRVELQELLPYEGANQEKLKELSNEAGVELLVDGWGVKGEPDELAKAVNEVRGHALALTLLGSHLNAMSNVDGKPCDIERRNEVGLTSAGRSLQTWGEYGSAVRTLQRYVKWFQDVGLNEQLAILRLLGFFNRPASPGALAALLQDPPLHNRLAPLHELNETDWKLLIDYLAEAGLVWTVEQAGPALRGYDKSFADQVTGERAAVWPEPGEFTPPGPGPRNNTFKGPLDAHPLLREFFADEMCRESQAAWETGHSRLFDYLKSQSPYWPDGMEGLQLLYQAIAHACQAKRFTEAFEIFDRVSRGELEYSTKTLGAFSAELGAIRCFFEKSSWIPLTDQLGMDEPWLLNQAGLCLWSLGRLDEAAEPMRLAVTKLGATKHASICASNLCQLDLARGEVMLAVQDGHLALKLASAFGNEWELHFAAETALGYALFQAGQEEEASRYFASAEGMNQTHHPQRKTLCQLAGANYDELILADAEREVWRLLVNRLWNQPLKEDPAPFSISAVQPVSQADAVNKCHEAWKRAKFALSMDRDPAASARDHLTLATVSLYLKVLKPEAACSELFPMESACKDILEVAERELEIAMEEFAMAGSQDELPKGLMKRAMLRQLKNDCQPAFQDLEQAEQITERGGMRLNHIDVLLHKTRFFGDVPSMKAAGELIQKCGYHRRAKEMPIDESGTA